MIHKNKYSFCISQFLFIYLFEKKYITLFNEDTLDDSQVHKSEAEIDFFIIESSKKNLKISFSFVL